MRKEHMLVGLVVADVVLAFSVIGAELFFNWTLPGPLQEYAAPQSILPSSLGKLFVFGLWSLTIAATLVAWVGLINRWWLARRLYVFAWGTWILLMLLSGPSVMTPLGAAFSTVESVVGGLILGLVYFSDLSRSFERPVAALSVTA